MDNVLTSRVLMGISLGFSHNLRDHRDRTAAHADDRRMVVATYRRRALPPAFPRLDTFSGVQIQREVFVLKKMAEEMDDFNDGAKGVVPDMENSRKNEVLSEQIATIQEFAVKNPRTQDAAFEITHHRGGKAPSFKMRGLHC